MTLYQSGAVPAGIEEEAGEAWWTTPYGSWRLSAESEAMGRFPGFSLHRPDGGPLIWAGRLRSGLNRHRRYIVTVTYPRRFPHEAPLVAITSPRLARGTPHLLHGNHPCLYHGGRSPRSGYDPARTTAATLVAWTALWIHAYETWRATGTWPGRED